MSRLILIRHGETDWNVTGRWQGQADVPLNGCGREQAERLARDLAGQDIAAIYSSDLSRARDTAAPLAHLLGLTIIVDGRLREVNLGAWEGMLSEDIASQYPQELSARRRNPLHARAPQGESVMEVIARIIEAVKEITARHPNETVAIVSHGVALAAVICQAEAIPLAQIYTHIPENAKPYIVEWD